MSKIVGGRVFSDDLVDRLGRERADAMLPAGEKVIEAFGNMDIEGGIDALKNMFDAGYMLGAEHTLVTLEAMSAGREGQKAANLN